MLKDGASFVNAAQPCPQLNFEAFKGLLPKVILLEWSVGSAGHHQSMSSSSG